MINEVRANNSPEQVELIRVHMGYFWDPERKDPFQDMSVLLGCTRYEAKSRVFEFLWANRGTIGTDQWWKNNYFRNIWLMAELSKATGWDSDEIEFMLNDFVQEKLKVDSEKRPLLSKGAPGTA